MPNIDFVFVFALGLVQWRVAQAQSGICTSSGDCMETEKFCQSDSLKSCFCGSNDMPSTHITYDEGAGENVRTSCSDSRCTDPDAPSNIFVENVTLNYASINPRYFNIRVSWSRTESSGSRGGYELRLIKVDGGTTLCYCIEDSKRTSVTLHNIRYEDLKLYKSIDVLPYPHLQINEVEIKVSQQLLQNIRGCADIKNDRTLCGSKPYPKPENLRVKSHSCENNKKKLNIKWDPPNVGSDVPLPAIYHLSLHSDPIMEFYTQYFTVQNARQVMLINVNTAQKYKVYVRPYRRCSGLGDAAGNLGCGASAEQIEERIGNCDSSTPDRVTTLTSEITVATLYRSEGSVEEQTNATHDMNLRTVLTSVIVTSIFFLVIVVSLVVFLCTKFNKHLKGENHSYERPSKMVDYIYKVFVFYLPSLTQTHKDYIQKYVICYLMKRFKVITPDDISRENDIWIEDAVNSADSVLLVGNEEFCFEWEKKERSPIMNSLELLITAAASQNNLAKFGFILTGESRDDHIPENSYLKLMPVFFMGEKKCEAEKVSQFVRSRGIERAQEPNYDEIKV